MHDGYSEDDTTRREQNIDGRRELVYPTIQYITASDVRHFGTGQRVMSERRPVSASSAGMLQAYASNATNVLLSPVHCTKLVS